MTIEHNVLSVDNEVLCREAAAQFIECKGQGYPISTSNEYFNHIVDFCINKKKKTDGYSCVVGYTTLQVDGYLNARPCWYSSFQILGNLKSNGIIDIWCSKQMNEYRQRMIKGHWERYSNMCNEVAALINEV